MPQIIHKIVHKIDAIHTTSISISEIRKVKKEKKKSPTAVEVVTLAVGGAEHGRVLAEKWVGRGRAGKLPQLVRDGSQFPQPGRGGEEDAAVPSAHQRLLRHAACLAGPGPPASAR